jgi:hypothetical protein
VHDSISRFWYIRFRNRVALSEVDLNLVDWSVNGMIKPRGTKAKVRMPKIKAPTPGSDRAKKSDGEQASSKLTSARPGISKAFDGAGISPSDIPETLPLALAGRWVAWSADGLRIIGSGATLKDAEEVALQAGENEPIFQRAFGKHRR